LEKIKMDIEISLKEIGEILETKSVTLYRDDGEEINIYIDMQKEI